MTKLRDTLICVILIYVIIEGLIHGLPFGWQGVSDSIVLHVKKSVLCAEQHAHQNFCKRNVKHMGCGL